jgi:tetratricopeptide (TPR) repeat protein
MNFGFNNIKKSNKAMKTTMRIRIALLPLLMILGVGSLQAQECDPQVWEPMDEEKEEKCTGKLSVFHSDVKQKNYNGALPHWRYYFCNCPKEDNGQKWVYIDGAKIMVAKIKENKGDKEVAKAYYDTLMMIYDNWIINYGEEGKVTGYKGLYTYAYQNGTLDGLDQARQYFEKSMELEGEKSTYQTVTYYMSVVQKLTKYKRLDTTYWVEKYFSTSEIIDANLGDSGKYFDKWQKTREDIDNMMAPVLTCDQLIPMYEKKMTENPTKEDLAKMVIFMERKNCTESETYEKAASMLCNIEPSATCKAALGKIKYGKGDYSGAVALFKEALELQEDAKEDAKYHLSIADCYVKMGSTSAALSSTNAAIANDPSFGRAYMLRGSIYATKAKDCKDDFDSKACYWVVVDQFTRAKSVDPSLSETCNSRIASYSKYFPAKQEIFFKTYEVGQAYTVKCLGVSTTIRAKVEE